MEVAIALSFNDGIFPFNVMKENGLKDEILVVLRTFAKYM